MRSAPHPDDATARARIRDSAIELFGRDGYAATSIRAIAAASGTSPALVLHHFGSKDGLRDECDREVLEQVFGVNSRMLADADSAEELGRVMAEALADVAALRPRLDYLGRLLLEGGATGDRLFDRFVAHTEATLRQGVADGQVLPTDDPEARALLVTLHGLSTLVFAQQIGRRLGGDGLDDATIQRLTVPTMELYTNGLYADQTMLDVARGVLDDPVGGPPDGKGDGRPNQDPDPPR